VQRWILVLLEQVALVALLARKLHRSHMKGDDVVSAFRYLREPYEKRFYWWEIVAIGRRTLIVALIAFLATNRRTQFVTVIFACIFALLVQLHASPFRERSSNALEAAVITYHLALAALLTVADQPYGVSTAAALGAVVFIPSLLLLLFVAVKAARRLSKRSAADNESPPPQSLGSMSTFSLASLLSASRAPPRFAKGSAPDSRGGDASVHSGMEMGPIELAASSSVDERVSPPPPEPSGSAAAGAAATSDSPPVER
jgi:hypothetical protein